MYDVRIFFSKTGRARYISHLDLNRCMQRALKRSGLPVVYTQGFNPHIRNTFALPLSLGYEGETETMDFRLEQELPLEEVARRLRESLPAELFVLRAAAPVMKPEKIRWGRYAIEAKGEPQAVRRAAESLRDLLAQPELLVEKTTKKGGTRQIDIRPDLRLESLEEGEGSLRFTLLVTTGISRNINPSLLLDLLPGAGKEFSLRVRRTAVLTEELEPFC